MSTQQNQSKPINSPQVNGGNNALASLALIRRHIIYVIVGASLLIIGILHSFNIISTDSISGWVALILSVFGIYYTYEALVMNVKLEHSKDLRKFVSDWITIHRRYYLDVIPNVAISYSQGNFKANKEQYSLNAISEDILCDDLLKNHLYKQTSLKREWEMYEKIVKEYEDVCNQLRDNIQSKIENKIKLISPHYKIDYFYNEADTICLNFADVIYLRYRGWIKDDLILKSMETSYSVPLGDNKWDTSKVFQVSAQTKDNTRNFIIAYVKEKETADRYLKVFEALYSKVDEETLPYLKMVEDIDKEQDRLYNAVSINLTNLNKYPIYGEKCEFVKRAL